ncbi:MAG: AAA family ATPase [Patescibacteria group bacterium]
MKKFILVINGPICSGKSTVSELLLKKIPNSFRISMDKIKWFIGNYSKDKHRKVAYRLTLELARNALREGFSLIVDGSGRFDKNSNSDYKKLAKECKISYIEINIEAPIIILIKRFKERVARAKAVNSNISCTTVKKMKEFYNGYLEYKDNDLITLDSGLNSPEQISNIIIKLIYPKQKNRAKVF